MAKILKRGVKRKRSGNTTRENTETKNKVKNNVEKENLRIVTKGGKPPWYKMIKPFMTEVIKSGAKAAWKQKLPIGLASGGIMAAAAVNLTLQSKPYRDAEERSVKLRQIKKEFKKR